MNKLLSRSFILIIISTAVTITGFSQIIQPVKWSFTTEKIENNEYNLVFKAKIDKNWHLYSQFLPKGNFSLPTVFSFDTLIGVDLLDTVMETSTIHKEKDELAGVMSHFFIEEAIFKQRVKINGNNPSVKGIVDFQACDDEQCIKGDAEFSFTIANQQAQVDGQKPGTTETTKSLWKIIIEAILWGFVALLTPCVFPMVPMTVSFFMKDSSNKMKSKVMASTYGISIVALYTIPIAIIILATYIFGGSAVTADIFNWLSTHWLPNIIFFLIFMIFAASFFGAFEIVMPSSLVNKADSSVDKGGMAGAFFMALTLVLVSFSCTGPIVGTIMVKSTQGEFWEPIVTMFAFSVAFALPFTLFAFFPGWLNKLPKSGGWLNSVKVVLGFVEIALGLKFLSTADQAYHWRILDREIYLAIWIVTFTLLGFYLLGKLRFEGDSKSDHVSVPRLVLAIITFSFVVYLIPGMFGAPLKVLSGYLPPQYTMDFDMERIVRQNSTNKVSDTESNSIKNKEICEKPKYADFLHLPHGLEGYFDYEQAIACARAQGKPLFIDFTGHGCNNCREMEARVWSDPQVLKRLNEQFVIVALYVDDKTQLPENEWIKSDYDGKWKKSLGKKNADFQISKFNINAQPYYCLLDHDGNLLVDPIGYNLNIDEFVDLLDRGVEAFKKR